MRQISPSLGFKSAASIRNRQSSLGCKPCDLIFAITASAVWCRTEMPLQKRMTSYP
jgi:hypothetical protein